jgi:hypothetical protein
MLEVGPAIVKVAAVNRYSAPDAPIAVSGTEAWPRATGSSLATSEAQLVAPAQREATSKMPTVTFLMSVYLLE